MITIIKYRIILLVVVANKREIMINIFMTITTIAVSVIIIAVVVL